MGSREKGFELDLESGVSASEEDVRLKSTSSKGRKKFLGSVELLVERSSGGEKMCEMNDERCRKSSPRNALKPPRPPKGPLLDAADQKFVREIIEVAKRKRAIIEQRKVTKKMKESKSSSSSLNSGISAMIITLLFFFVIIFQGISFKSVPNVSIQQGSPEPAIAVATQGLVSAILPSDIPTSSYRIQNFPKDRVSGSGRVKEVRKLMDNAESG